MSPADTLKHGEKFDGSGFHSWRFKTELGLVQHRVKSCIEEKIDGSSISKEMEDLAFTYIMLSLADNVQAVVRNCKTARETWLMLNNKYGEKDIQDRLELRERIRNVKMGSNVKMIDHLAVIANLVEQLKAAGGDLPEEEVIITILQSLSRKYDQIKVLLRTKFRGEKMSVNDLQDVLLSEERNMNLDVLDSFDGTESSAYAVRSDSRKCFTCGRIGHISNVCKENTTLDGRLLCYKCKSKEHLERRCPRNNTSNFKERRFIANKRYQGRIWKKNGANSAEVQNENLFLVSREKLHTHEWLLDSGASQHMCNEKSYFIDIVPTTSIKIWLADGGCIIPKGMGDIQLLIKNLNRTLVVKDVLYVEELDRNLLSVARLAKDGINVSFQNGYAVARENGNKIFLAEETNGLYKIDVGAKSYKVSISANAEVNNNVNNADINEWHRRMGHASEVALKHTLKINGTLAPCSICSLTNFPRKPFNKAVKRETSILERVYTDICGPFRTPSFGGAKYFIIFVDGYSRIIKAYAMKSKDEVLLNFKHYTAHVEQQTGKKLKALRCDNGGEFTSSSFRNYCNSKGILIEYTSPYTSQQNGVSERHIRTLSCMVRSLIQDAGLSDEYWAEALQTAVFLKNRTASRTLEWNSPYYMWYKEDPKLENKTLQQERLSKAEM